MKRSKVAALLAADSPRDAVRVKGWVRTRRDSKGFSFIELNDGSALQSLQIVADGSLPNYDAVKKANTGSALAVSGPLVPSKGKGQKWELQAQSVEIIHLAPEDYPLQKKRHTDEYLRTIAHLRPRTNKYGAIFRIRSELAVAIHLFFREQGFRYIHTPVLTGSDCEGAGELFTVTALDLDQLPTAEGKTDFSQDFFGQEAKLTVSGQLSAEMFALALGDVYTFGPTFRAENSNTSRHVAEFWMVEPEMAFCDLECNMALAESMIRYLIGHIQAHCPDDLALFARWVDKSLTERLDTVLNTPFVRLTHQQAVEILQQSGETFEYPPALDRDLQSEHETYLTQTHFNGPVIVYNYPRAIKPFYMRVNDDGQTVAGMDVLVPGVGEIIGGSQREERLELLRERMAETGLSPEEYWWYLDSRRYGSVPHSGFGLGFERLLMFLTGVSNIRDVLPFPRTPGRIEF